MTNSTKPIACSYVRSSPAPTGSAAIAIIELQGDIDGALNAMGVSPVGVGKAGLRRWKGVDDLVVARVTEAHALLFPHAGPAVLTRVLGALSHAGLSESPAGSALPRHPEAVDELEARMLDALARAHSPLAVDMLLAQPERSRTSASAAHSEAESGVLRRLITPALVVALGPPNIGKSSLLNALAGRQVALVADEPGTTRDHVGVQLNLAGLVVRYLDAPGIDTDRAGLPSILREAQEAALGVASAADLILLCADSGGAFLSPPSGRKSIRVGLRCDRGLPLEPCDVVTSVKERQGLVELASCIRENLVPRVLLESTRPWAFWEANRPMDKRPA